MNEDEFIDTILAEAQRQGHEIEEIRNGRQFNFGHKKLHEGHLRKLFPSILEQGAKIPALIDAVASGRPCSHKPMKEIISNI